ncbi:copper-binding protein [Piscinibacter sp.]|uniref:copper-binding protein n=1 Tax=Piscinibacter sp. TaxID=1903157 RepID=UPI0039E372D2
MNTIRLIAALGLSLAFDAHAQAGAPDAHTSHTAQAAGATDADAGMADGEVRKVDKAQGKVTLKHGPIASLDMPGMTMVFRVANPAMLDGLKEGDKVKFTAARLNGAITITAMAPAR